VFPGHRTRVPNSYKGLGRTTGFAISRFDGQEVGVMALSEYEYRTLCEIETGCRAEDPDFVETLDFTAAADRRSRAIWLARAAVWVGWILLLTGAATARGVLSLGTFLTFYGALILTTGAVSRWRLRTPRTTKHSGPRRA
jgi:hypothetical protein